jgi:hypothetical protein
VLVEPGAGELEVLAAEHQPVRRALGVADEAQRGVVGGIEGARSRAGSSA